MKMPPNRPLVSLNISTKAFFHTQFGRLAAKDHLIMTLNHHSQLGLFPMTWKLISYRK